MRPSGVSSQDFALRQQPWISTTAGFGWVSIDVGSWYCTYIWLTVMSPPSAGEALRVAADEEAALLQHGQRSIDMAFLGGGRSASCEREEQREREKNSVAHPGMLRVG